MWARVISNAGGMNEPFQSSNEVRLSLANPIFFTDGLQRRSSVYFLENERHANDVKDYGGGPVSSTKTTTISPAGPSASSASSERGRSSLRPAVSSPRLALGTAHAGTVEVVSVSRSDYVWPGLTGIE